MKESGIVRKLDNLGRLVIPKEIRRCMRIKEGSPIEFGLTPSGEIILYKYSLINQISDYADDFCEVLGEIFDSVVYVGDRDKVISSFGVSKKNSIGYKLSEEVLQVMDSKNTYKSSVDEKLTIYPILLEDKNTYTAQIICPISIQGDIEGVIILCSLKKDVVFGESQILCLKAISKFLSIQMD